MNPCNASPKQLMESSEYERARDEQPHTYWPSGAEVVFRHKASDTYWRGFYEVEEDSSDWDKPTTWKQVWPVVKTIRTFTEDRPA